jgi:hypothetical protein
MVRHQREDVSNEFLGASFGDGRLNRRLVDLTSRMASAPDASFPVATESDANLEGTYRFLNNERVTPEKILAPHLRMTLDRVAGNEVVVAHDTTEFNFGDSEREDLGRVGRGKSHGFYAHVALALGRKTRDPLGVLGHLVHERHGGKGRRGHEALQSADDNEGLRWAKLVEIVEVAVGRGVAVHVMDREADSYALFAELVARGARFVVRMVGDKRRIAGTPTQTVGEVLATKPLIVEREVPISARGRSRLPSQRKLHPPRHARLAQLHICAAPVTIVRPDSSSHAPAPTLALNVVKIFEPNPPEGEPAVEWRLWTTEPIDSADQVLAVVDAYRCRWVIEEFFKALKTGCAVEERQLESSHGLQNTLAIFMPIAWRLLSLRMLSRSDDKAPATRVMTANMITCLRLALRKRGRPPLPPKPTVKDALLGVAGLGGHIKNNGDPGWIVIGRGFNELLTILDGFEMARESSRSEES